MAHHEEVAALMAENGRLREAATAVLDGLNARMDAAVKAGARQNYLRSK